MTWIFHRKTKFVRQFKKLDTLTQKRVRNALKEIAHSTDPARLGEYKQSIRAYVYDVGKNHRLLYDVKHADHEIELLRVGDHKAVYGRD